MKYKKLAVGGTFDKFHNGHKRLIEESFKYGENVVIGVSSDIFANEKGVSEDCKTRMTNLKDFLSKSHKNFEVSKLDDPYGTTITEPDFEAIVVSKETELTALKINEIRKEKDMKPIDIIVIDFVFAEDGVPISSTRIRKGEIDKEGHLL